MRTNEHKQGDTKNKCDRCLLLDSALGFNDVTPGKVGRNRLGNAHVERLGKGFLMFICIAQTRRKTGSQVDVSNLYCISVSSFVFNFTLR